MTAQVQHVHVVDDDRETRLLLGAWLQTAGYTVCTFGSGTEFLAHDGPPASLVCLDLRMPKLNGLEVLHEMRTRGLDTPVVVFTADDDVQTAVECMKRGAFDFQVKPIKRSTFVRVVEAALRRPASRTALPEATPVPAGPTMLGSSAELARVRDEIAKVCDTNITVFVRGESGTGKELVARSIHASSPRAEAPFIALNCGAIPESLQESVLFGHEKGAFTGAAESRKGKFELADGGTIFLDEIAELSPSAQVRLLRVLQERQVERLGGTQPLAVDVRVISATHRDLDVMVANGSFRQDLFYRLVIYPITVPPLRVRVGDIRELFEFYLDKHAAEIGFEAPSVRDDAWAALAAHRWPGNVRELANLAHRCVVAHRGGVLDGLALGLPPAEASPPPPAPAPADPTPAVPAPSPRPGGTKALAPTLADAERRAMQEALDACDGNITAAAKRLGIGRATFYRKLTRYGIKRAG